MLIKKKKSEDECATAEKELVLVPWIDLDKLSVIQDPEDGEVSEDLKLRQELLEQSKTTCGAGRNKKSVFDWLTKHQLSVEELEDGLISIQGGLAKLRPPYSAAEDCEAANVIILDRITAILDQMPAEN